MANSAMDFITGPLGPNWSVTGWTSQMLVSSAVVLATGGTYETKAPARKSESVDSVAGLGVEESEQADRVTPDQKKISKGA